MVNRNFGPEISSNLIVVALSLLVVLPLVALAAGLAWRVFCSVVTF